MTISTNYQSEVVAPYTKFIDSSSIETNSLDVHKSHSATIIRLTNLKTSDNEESDENISGNQSPVHRIYPHIFDEAAETGQAVNYINSALNDAQSALDAFDDSDFQTINTCITQAAAAMKQAYPLTLFNESLGIVISYIRRAALAVSIEDISRASLNALVQVLQLVASNPMIDLDDASDLVDKLSEEGWNGEHQIANQLIDTLLSNAELNESELKTLLSQLVEE